MEKGRKHLLSLFLAAIGPILLAGLREKNIGIDIRVYVEPVFKLAEASISLSNFIARHGDGTEYGYLTYMYALTKIFDSFFVVMLTNHAIIISACLYALHFFKKRYNVTLWFGYAIMLLHFYNPSLCLVRQSLGMSLALVGLVMLLEKRYFFFAITAVLSFLMHKSMISFIGAYVFVYVIISNVKSTKYKILALVVIFASISFASSFLGLAMTMVDAKYADRIASSDSNSGGTMTIILYALLSLLPFVMHFIYKKKKIPIEFFFYLPIFGFIFQFLGKQIIYLTRLAVPFMAMIMLTIPFALQKKSHRLLFLSLMLALWIMNIYLRKDWETVPYIVGNYFGI